MIATLGNNIRLGMFASLVLSILAAWLAGCGSVTFCCLGFEPGTPELTYCNAHSRAAGHLLLDAEEVSADSLNAALDWVERLVDDTEECRDVGCVELVINSDPGLSTLWQKYQEEHRHADSVLAAGGIEFCETAKVYLIRCGFSDAAQRTRENIKEGRQQP